MSVVLVTGGAGFIGSNFVRLLLRESDHQVVNLDALTYAGNLENLIDVHDELRYTFAKGDIADRDRMQAVFNSHRPEIVVHFAAESHVDRSVMDAGAFVRTNAMGTQVLLDMSRSHEVQRFVHVSTDEVYGSLGPTGLFTEKTPLQPNSPYSASKAASDMLVQAAIHTHGMDAVITPRASRTSLGCSAIIMWPQPASVMTRTPGMASARGLAAPGGVMASRSPSTMRVGQRIWPAMATPPV